MVAAGLPPHLPVNRRVQLARGGAALCAAAALGAAEGMEPTLHEPAIRARGGPPGRRNGGGQPRCNGEVALGDAIVTLV